jgi:hypothetical protein
MHGLWQHTRCPVLSLCCPCAGLLLTHLQEEQRELANTIRVSGSILLSTVSNFLDFFKLEAVRRQVAARVLTFGIGQACVAVLFVASLAQVITSPATTVRLPPPDVSVCGVCCLSCVVMSAAASNSVWWLLLLQGKRLDIVRSEVVVSDLVGDVHCIIEAMIGRAGSVTLHPPQLHSVPDVVCCDPDRLRGVLLNLYTNAGEDKGGGGLGWELRVVPACCLEHAQARRSLHMCVSQQVPSQWYRVAQRLAAQEERTELKCVRVDAVAVVLQPSLRSVATSCCGCAASRASGHPLPRQATTPSCCSPATYPAAVQTGGFVLAHRAGVIRRGLVRIAGVQQCPGLTTCVAQPHSACLHA